MLWIDGQPSEHAAPLDRGLEFGDGLFETMAVCDGRVRLLERHLQRLQAGCAALQLPMPAVDVLKAQIAHAAATPGTAVLKLLMTRGPGGTGYGSLPDAPARCYLVASGARRPPSGGARVVRLASPIGQQPRLAGLKHLNRLEQVMLKRDLTALNADEGLVCDSEGRLVCGVMSNVFLSIDGVLVTPALERCGIAGVMRGALLDHLASVGAPVQVRDVALDECARAGEIFLTNALVGIWPVIELDGAARLPGPWSRRLAAQVSLW